METENKFQAKGKVKSVKGSVLVPESGGLRFVLSVSNMIGKPENPLFPLFANKWKKVQEESRGWFATKTGAYKLGAINTTAVQSDVWVIHMLCQDDTLKLDLAALESCLQKVVASAKYEKASIHVSSILTSYIPGLEKVLDKAVVSQGLAVYYYDEPSVKEPVAPVKFVKAVAEAKPAKSGKTVKRSS